MNHSLFLAVLIASIPAIAPRAKADVSAERGLTLVRDGEPTSTIVIAKDATKAAQLAAYELQWHLKKITGAEILIVSDNAAVKGTRILVGESAATEAVGLKSAELKMQEYMIRFLPNALVLMGRDKDDRGKVKYIENGAYGVDTWPDFWDERGTMDAVYDFLERCCNVRWFNPTEAGIVYPETKTLKVAGKDIRRAPAFRYRFACYLTSENYDAFTNLWPQGSDGFNRQEAASFAGLHKRFPDRWQYMMAKRGLVQLFRYRMREGGEKCMANHSLYGYYQRFWEKNPGNPEAFVGKKPDWFAQGYEGTPPQMCYTNPGLIKQVAQDACDYFDGKGINPWSLKPIKDRSEAWGENFFCVEPMDNSSFCKCPRCQALIGRTRETRGVYSTSDHSDYFFHFVNEVAKEVRKTHPDKYIVTLAYMTHAYPPKRFHLEPNVAVQFCFACNRLPYVRQDYDNELRALKAWAEQSKERPLYLWLYYTFPVEIANNGKFNCFPGFFAHTIGEQFKLFHKYGYRGMFHCGYGQEVEAYLTYKLMDDPTIPVDKILDEYFTRYYGHAAGPMKKLYLAIEETYCDPANYPERPGHQNVQIAWGRLGTEARMSEFGTLMRQAKDLAETDTERRRVDLFELGTWNYMLEGSRKYVARMSAPIPSLRVPRVSDANGDATKVDWTKAADLEGTWYERGQFTPAPRKLSGRAAHDGKFLYLELTDPCDSSKLVASSGVAPYDDWEIFVAGQRALPYRQYMVGPSGLVVALSHGEVNWRMNVGMLDHGIKVTPDVSATDKWVTRVAIPLSNLIKGGITPGGKFYMNIVRVTSPQITGTGGLGIDSWVSHCTVHDVDRLAEVTIE